MLQTQHNSMTRLNVVLVFVSTHVSLESSFCLALPLCNSCPPYLSLCCDSVTFFSIKMFVAVDAPGKKLSKTVPDTVVLSPVRALDALHGC